MHSLNDFYRRHKWRPDQTVIDVYTVPKYPENQTTALRSSLIRKLGQSSLSTAKEYYHPLIISIPEKRTQYVLTVPDIPARHAPHLRVLYRLLCFQILKRIACKCSVVFYTLLAVAVFVAAEKLISSTKATVAFS